MIMQTHNEAPRPMHFDALGAPATMHTFTCWISDDTDWRGPAEFRVYDRDLTCLGEFDSYSAAVAFIRSRCGR